MKILSELHDKKIDSKNYLLELTIDEYTQIAETILEKNPFQRKKIRNSRSIYTLLQRDLLDGCVIPPIVLAYTGPDFTQSFDYETLNKNKKALIILDGLQRTYTILDAVNSIETEDKRSTFLKRKLRIELYTSINRVGILYRMLTLNTGQTPMSLRHQIEILYTDYLGENATNMVLVTEADGGNTRKLEAFAFKDVVEGFNAFLERDELPITKSQLLNDVEDLKSIARYAKQKDLFEAFCNTYYSIVNKFNELVPECETTGDSPNPFGKNIQQIFKKSQALTGFGAAVGGLIELEVIKEFDEIAKRIDQLNKIEDSDSIIDKINFYMEEIKSSSKKIGNSQRTFFKHFFRTFFNPGDEFYLSMHNSIKRAYKKYRAEG